MTLDEALAFIRAMPLADREAAFEQLARAAAAGPGVSNRWTTFDPLECTSAMATECRHRGRTEISDDRICASVLDPSLPCPHGNRDTP